MTDYWQLQLDGKVTKDNGITLEFNEHVLEGGSNEVCRQVANIKVHEWKSLKQLGFLSASEFD